MKEVAARTAAPATEDLDIASWLEETEDNDTDVSRAVATPETRQFHVDDTSNLALETSVEGKPQEDAVEVDDLSEESSDLAEGDKKTKKLSDRWKKSEPGKLPPRPTVSSKDSREAAADMLKRFFNRG